MNRRDVLKGAGALAGVTMASGALGAATTGRHVLGNQSRLLSSLTASVAECLAWCEKCELHCIDMVSQGATEFATTLARVRECADMCRTMITYSESNSKLRGMVAQTCAAVCRDCAAECNKHAAVSEICRECAKACEHCAALCEAVPS